MIRGVIKDLACELPSLALRVVSGASYAPARSALLCPYDPLARRQKKQSHFAGSATSSTSRTNPRSESGTRPG